MSDVIYKDIIILGAGAAGCSAAITAARLNASVLLFESSDSILNKVKISGNGRANITNNNMGSDCYRSDSASEEFISSIISNDADSIVKEFVKSLGVLTTSISGYVYPHTRRSETLIAAYDREIKRLYDKITIIYSAEIKRVTQCVYNNEECYEINYNSKRYISKNVIVATGSKASNTKGSSDDGYYIANTLGISVIDARPALVGLKLRSMALSKASGVRVLAKASLLKDGSVVCADSGEIQIKDDGVSGIVINQLSRYVCDNSSYELMIDFAENLSEQELGEFFEAASGCDDKIHLLEGIVDKKLADCIYDEDDLIGAIKSYRIHIASTYDMNSAQVAAGGVDTRELCEHTLESKKYNGLYFVGEVVDIDGKSGGYNITFAVLTGINAARNSVSNL